MERVHTFHMPCCLISVKEGQLTGPYRLSGSWTLWLEMRRAASVLSICLPPPQDINQTDARVTTAKMQLDGRKKDAPTLSIPFYIANALCNTQTTCIARILDVMWEGNAIY